MSRSIHSLCASLVVVAFVSATPLRAQDREDYKSQLDTPAPTAKTGDPAAFRILCVGDSITRHGTSADTEKRLGWSHVAGMAASSEEFDYAHLLQRRIQETMPRRPVELYFHTSGGSGSAKQRLSAVAEALRMHPHLVVVQLGEHEKEADGEAVLRESYDALLTAFARQEPPPVIIATGIWSLSKQASGADGRLQYTGWAATVETAMREICERHGGRFVSVSDLAGDPACRGWGQHPGVKWHPNDKGHAGYASKIFSAFAAASARTPAQ